MCISLLCAFGLLIGLAVAPTIASYASADPQALWQAGGRRHCSLPGWRCRLRHPPGSHGGRPDWLLGPGGPSRLRHRVDLREPPARALIYSILGLVIFAGFTVVDFQRVRRSTDAPSAPLLAASIFLDILNVFLFFLQIFSRSNDR